MKRILPKTELETYIQRGLQPTPVLMGIAAGNTRIFNISKKLTLINSLQLSVNNDVQSHSMREWIKNNPRLIWEHVYGYKKPRVSLARDSHGYLMQLLKEKHPDLYKEIQDQKLKAAARKNYRALGKNGSLL
jgi:hypothetical protein